MRFINDRQRRACFARLSGEFSRRIRFAEAPFDPRKTLELLEVGMLDPTALSEDQKAQIEIVQEEIKTARGKALRALNERIERGDTYRPKELWSQEPIRIRFKEPRIIKFEMLKPVDGPEASNAKSKKVLDGEVINIG